MRGGSSPDPQASFRAGVLGLAHARHASTEADAMQLASMAPNEREAALTVRVPGLTEPRAAYECGRVVRAVTLLLDQAGAPGDVGRTFIDNLRAACVAHRTRPSSGPWGALETIEMFLEMYDRILDPAALELVAVSRALMAFALDEGAAVPQGLPTRLRGR